MKRLFRWMLLGLLLACQSCATAKLWKDANPNERVWIDASKTTEEALQAKGVKYEVYASANHRGYLIEKSGLEKMKDYQLRMLGTPVTVVVDAATTVLVVGVYVFLSDPEGSVNLIQALSR